MTTAARDTRAHCKQARFLIPAPAGTDTERGT